MSWGIAGRSRTKLEDKVPFLCVVELGQVLTLVSDQWLAGQGKMDSGDDEVSIPKQVVCSATGPPQIS